MLAFNDGEMMATYIINQYCFVMGNKFELEYGSVLSCYNIDKAYTLLYIYIYSGIILHFYTHKLGCIIEVVT